MINDFENVEDYYEALSKRKGYVYAIGHFGAVRSDYRDMARAFYIGKTLTRLDDRIPGHEKREKDSEVVFIEFHSHAETNYAEKVLIQYLKPSKNKCILDDFENAAYANALLSRFWESAMFYGSDSKLTISERDDV